MRVRAARLKRGLTQERLAELVSVDSKTISRLENGHHPITVDLLATLAHALRVPSASLLPGDHPPGWRA